MLGRHHAKRSTLPPSTPSHESKDHLTINIDFVQLLNAITCQYQISLNEPNVMSLDNGNFQSILEIECPGNSTGIHYLISTEYSTTNEASQDVAKQTINILQMAFDYEIFDINYDLMLRLLDECYTKRDRCIALEIDSRFKTMKGINK